MAKDSRKLVYGFLWNAVCPQITIELEMCRRGGLAKRADGSVAGLGMFEHWKRAQQQLWPNKVWHKWNELQSQCYLNHRTVAVIGPASSGKTNSAATDVLLDYYLYPTSTTVIICSTTKERLEDRIWGEIKKFHKDAKERFPWLPGNLIEGRMRLVTDDRSMAEEGRDFRNGIVGVPCEKGGSFVGLGSFAGLKNKRVRLVGDELSLLPKVFVDAISNLDKNPDFKAIGLGNPKETTDALGVLAEPSAEMGGWDSGIDQVPKTKTWPTRRGQGICLQLVGSDSPNLDGKMGIPLITQEAIDRDIAFYTKDSVQFTMMNQGMMPRGQGSHRVLTRQMCEKFHAFDQPIWRDTDIKRIAFADAGYGGDRCIFGELAFGRPSSPELGDVASLGGLANNEAPQLSNRKILAIIDTMVVPVTSGNESDLPEDQVVKFIADQCSKRGIPLTDFFYDPGMRTKLTVAFNRITGQIGNPIDCGGKASDRPVAEGVDVRCVDFYSKFITELWWSVRLVVESGQMRGLPQDAMWEFSAREWKNVGGNRKEVEPKDKMKEKMGRSPDCFVAGTMVETINGPMPIESIGIGEQVLTPFGPSPVVAVHAQDAETTCVELGDGQFLEGKGSHRVFTWDKGWVRLDELTIANELESANNLPIWQNLSESFTRDTRTTFKALVTIIKTAGMMCRRDFFTEPSGGSATAQSRMGWRFTTKTTTGETTRFPILNLGRPEIMPKGTPRRGWKKTPSFSNDGALPELRQPQLGIALRPVGLGTPSTLSIFGSIVNRSHYRVGCAVDSLNRSEMTPFTALIPVPVRHPELDIALSDTARFAGNRSWHTNSTPLSIAPGTVQPSQRPGKRRVYNLTLADHNVYYANGVLVENCADAIAIGVEGARQRGFVISKIGARNSSSLASDSWKTRLRLSAGKVWHAGDLNYAA